MNRAEKAAVIDEIAANITDANAIFAVDYRGITVAQASELRARLRDSDASLRVVKNSLTQRAADAVGAEQLKTLLAGPTALTFVRGDAAAAAKSLADFARTTQLLAFKGGVMDGAPVSAAELTAISRLPSRQVLYGQLVGLVANPISSLARTLNALVGGLAIGLGAVLEQKKSEPGAAAAPPAAEDPGATAGAAPALDDSPPSEELAEQAAPEPEAAEPATEDQAQTTEPAAASEPEESPAGGDEPPTADAQAEGV